LLAAPGDSLRLNLGEVKTVSRANVDGRLTLFNSEYVSSGQTYYRGDAANVNRGAAAALDLEKYWRSFGAHFSGRDEYSATEQWNYADVFEANVSWHPTDLSVFTLGRKLERWNEWEKDWHQGVFQPRYMENRLRSHEAGLAGIFYNQNTRPVALTLGFLPVAIPDFGAHHYVEDDRFVSKNPWFSPPARQFEYRQVVSDIRYSIDTPTIEEAALHAGGVAKLEFNGAKNYFGRVSGAYKPMPQFLLGFPSRGQVIIRPDEDFMNVRIQPRLAYHTLLSHDSIFRFGDWTVSGSLTREIPSRDASPEDQTAQQARPATIYSGAISHPLEAEGPYAARLSVGFLKVDGGDAPDKGDFAGQNTLFERRYQYNEAYSLGLTKPWRGLGRFPLDTGLRLIYDRLQNGGVASFSAGLNFSRSFRADLEVDFLGLFGGPAEIEDGFLALYRANDRVGLGLSYVY
jgi:hypothetical protein